MKNLLKESKTVLSKWKKESVNLKTGKLIMRDRKKIN